MSCTPPRASNRRFSSITPSSVHPLLSLLCFINFPSHSQSSAVLLRPHVPQSKQLSVVFGKCLLYPVCPLTLAAFLAFLVPTDFTSFSFHSLYLLSSDFPLNLLLSSSNIVAFQRYGVYIWLSWCLLLLLLLISLLHFTDLLVLLKLLS